MKSSWTIVDLIKDLAGLDLELELVLVLKLVVLLLMLLLELVVFHQNQVYKMKIFNLIGLKVVLINFKTYPDRTPGGADDCKRCIPC